MKANWKFFGLLAIGVAAIVVLTLVILKNREDRGLMEERCADARSEEGALRWAKSSLPIPIVIDSLAAEEWGGATILAARRWNDVVLVFREPVNGKPHDRERCEEPDEPFDPVVFVTRENSDGSEEDGRSHAKLFWDSSCVVRCVEVAMPGLAPKSDWEKIATHELGHALGLDHDDYEESVMYFGGKAMRWGMDKITESDRKLLLETYGNQ